MQQFRGSARSKGNQHGSTRWPAAWRRTRGSPSWIAWRLGAKAEPAIIEILKEPTFRSSGPENLIREYYEHWKDLPTPPKVAILKAIRDRVHADAKEGATDQYGLDVLKLAGDLLEEVKP